jgi:cytochrome c-type biogenesis protein CcmF
MLSCFWEGQEGSFLLWSFWHIILGNILIRKAGTWEAPVLTTVALVQAFLASMLLGIYIAGYKLGSNPFILLREHPDYANLPFVKIPTYLESLDGRGLNPLLQNYWMTIHPPILFLGFALTLVPFAYAIAGLWKKLYGEWIRPAMPWTLAGIMILGVGILMGGAWAYESLSFGGFWAWDPVENASLVPWLTLVSSSHLMIIYRNRGQSLFTTYLLTILTFVLILYSTFLTRSGILGETSVHAFTDLGMSGQLLVYLLFFLLLSAILLIARYKYLPKIETEESLWSREFWMFIGSLILFISSFQILFTTSIPVINKVFNSNLAPPLKIIEHYNSWQIPFAVLVCLVTAIGQHFKYKNTDSTMVFKKLGISAFASLVITAISIYFLKLGNYFYAVLFFASTFAVLANGDYWLRVLQGKIKKAGASIAHIGFGLILLGALISTGKSKIISHNNSGIDLQQLGKDFQNNENIMLSKGDTVEMGDYLVSYIDKKKEGVNIHYRVDYLTKNEAGKPELSFSLFPLIQTNPRMGNIAEPSTKHFLHKDIYTHITYADLEEHNEHEEDKHKLISTKEVFADDSIFTNNAIVTFEGLVKDINREQFQLNDSDIVIGAKLKATAMDGKTYETMPLYVIRDNYIVPVKGEIKELGLQFIFNKLNVENGKVTIETYEDKSNKKEFIIMKAMIFPGINILWIGCIIMALGTLLAIIQRIQSKPREQNT